MDAIFTQTIPVSPVFTKVTRTLDSQVFGPNFIPSDATIDIKTIVDMTIRFLQQTSNDWFAWSSKAMWADDPTNLEEYLTDFLSSIKKLISNNPAIPFVALIYIKRLAATPGFKLTRQSSPRVWSLAMQLAASYIVDDAYFRLDAWSDAAFYAGNGIGDWLSVSRWMTGQVNFLKALDWNLHIAEGELSHFIYTHFPAKASHLVRSKIITPVPSHLRRLRVQITRTPVIIVKEETVPAQEPTEAPVQVVFREVEEVDDVPVRRTKCKAPARHSKKSHKVTKKTKKGFQIRRNAKKYNARSNFYTDEDVEEHTVYQPRTRIYDASRRIYVEPEEYYVPLQALERSEGIPCCDCDECHYEQEIFMNEEAAYDAYGQNYYEDDYDYYEDDYSPPVYEKCEYCLATYEEGDEHYCRQKWEQKRKEILRNAARVAKINNLKPFSAPSKTA